MRAVRHGQHFLGGGKIEVIPKNKNREDLKKVAKNIGRRGAKNNLGG